MNRDDIFNQLSISDKPSFEAGWDACLKAHRRIDPSKYTKPRLYWANILVGASQLVNTLIGGDPDETCSSRIGKIRKNSKEGTWTKWVMDKGNVFFVYVMGEEDHWYSAIENDKGYRAVFRLKEEIMEDSVKE